MTIEEALAFEEMQMLERKNIGIEPKALAISIVAFANADGGIIAIGTSDKAKRIEGIDFEISKLNELLRVPFDFCNPAVKVELEKIPCINFQGRENHILLMYVKPSPEIYANQVDEVYLRVGDKSKLLPFDERLQFTYDRGERYFEGKPTPDVGLDDIDIVSVRSYIDKTGYTKTPLEYLRQNKGSVKGKNGITQTSTTAISLSGKNPQNFFPCARTRFIRHEGIGEKFGTEMGVIKDVIFEGNILTMLTDSVAYLDTQTREKTYLGQDGRFVTEEKYSKFIRQELVVDVVTHRAYSISGTDVQIKMFDNRVIVESPGKPPGLVRKDNMRYTHFSRNPKVAEFLKVYELVKEYSKGVDRTRREPESIGLKAPDYHTNAFLLQAVIYNSNLSKTAIEIGNTAIGDKKTVTGDEKTDFIIEEPAIETLRYAMSKCNFGKPTEENAFRVYEEIETNQTFGAPEIKVILSCATITSKDIMKKLRDMETVRGAKGRGKGEYRFAYKSEM